MIDYEARDYQGCRINYRQGEHVICGGHEYYVVSARLGDIWGPHYRLGAVGDSPDLKGALVSYVALTPKEGEPQ